MQQQQRLVERACAAWDDDVVIAAIAQLWRCAAAAKESALGAENVCNEEKLRLQEDRVAHYALERRARVKLAGMLGRLKETVDMMCEDRRIESAVAEVESSEMLWEYQDVQLVPLAEDAARHRDSVQGSALRIKRAIAAAQAARAPVPPLAVALSARNLRNLDFLSKSDPYVLLFRGRKTDAAYADKSAIVLQSTVVANDLNPVWPLLSWDAAALLGGAESEGDEGAARGVTLVVMDSDGALGKDDELGRCYVEMRDFVGARDLEVALCEPSAVADGAPTDDATRGVLRITCEFEEHAAPPALEEEVPSRVSVGAARLTPLGDEAALQSGVWVRFSVQHAEELNEAWGVLYDGAPVARLPALGEKDSHEETRPDVVRLCMPGRNWIKVDLTRMQWRTAACRRRVRRVAVGRLEGVRSLVRSLARASRLRCARHPTNGLIEGEGAHRRSMAHISTYPLFCSSCTSFPFLDAFAPFSSQVTKASTLLVDRKRTAEFVTEAVDDAAISALTIAEDALQWWHRPAEDRTRRTAMENAAAREAARRRTARDTRVAGALDDGARRVTRGAVASKRATGAHAFERDRKAVAAAEIARREESQLPPLAFNYARRV